jgi:hypothetical protein
VIFNRPQLERFGYGSSSLSVSLRSIGALGAPAGKNIIEVLRGTLGILTLKTLQWDARHGYGVARFVNITSILSLCLIFAASVVAQQNIQTPPTSPNVTAVIRVSSQFVVLDALVENKKTGNLVGGR